MFKNMSAKHAYGDSLIDTCCRDFELGVPTMDGTHREFAALVNSLAVAQGCDFVHLFTTLVDHTERHFAHENKLMEQSGFPPIHIHMAEHARVLAEMNEMKRQVSKGSIPFARAYVKERLPEWFKLHLATMDSALAFHLKQQQLIEV